MELIPIIKTVLLIISAISFLAVILSYIGYKIRNGSANKSVEGSARPALPVNTLHQAVTMSSQPVILHHSKMSPLPPNAQKIAVKKPAPKKTPPPKTPPAKTPDTKNAERYQILNDQSEFNGGEKGKKGDYVFKNPYTNQKFQP